MKLAPGTRRANLRGVVCVIALLGSTLGSSVATAEEPGVAALRRQVNTLNRVVLDLQARVKQLESRSASRPAPEPAATSAQTPAAAAPAVAAVPAAAPMPTEAKPAVITAAPAGTGAGYLSPEALLRQRWSVIDNGMADTRVHELLGEPSKKFKLNGRTVWYYYYPETGVGSVFFTDAGQVSSKQSPFGWSW